MQAWVTLGECVSHPVALRALPRPVLRGCSCCCSDLHTHKLQPDKRFPLAALAVLFRHEVQFPLVVIRVVIENGLKERKRERESSAPTTQENFAFCRNYPRPPPRVGCLGSWPDTLVACSVQCHFLLPTTTERAFLPVLTAVFFQLWSSLGRGESGPWSSSCCLWG